MIGGVINLNLGVIGFGGFGGVFVGYGLLGVGNGVEFFFEWGCSIVIDMIGWDIVIIEVRFFFFCVSFVDEVVCFCFGDDVLIFVGCGLMVVVGYYGSVCVVLGELVNVSVWGWGWEVFVWLMFG